MSCRLTLYFLFQNTFFWNDGGKFEYSISTSYFGYVQKTEDRNSKSSGEKITGSDKQVDITKAAIVACVL